MEKYELVLIKPNGEEVILQGNLTEQEAIEYFENINNTYIRKESEHDA